MAGVRGSSDRVVMVERAIGIVNCEGRRRHGVVPARLLGDIVSVIA